MKELIVTVAIVLGMGMSTFAQGEYYGSVNPTEDNGFFNLGMSFFNNDDDMTLFPEISEFDEEDMAYSNYSQNNWENGLFGKGVIYDRTTGNSLLALPGSHGSNDDSDAPLGSGIVLLAGMGAAYLLSNKKKD